MNSCVSYFVHRVGGCAEKLVHINNTRVFKERPASVSCVCAEETDEMEAYLRRSQFLCGSNCVGYDKGELKRLLDVCSYCFSECPGLCKVGCCVIELEMDAEVVFAPPPPPPIRSLRN